MGSILCRCVSGEPEEGINGDRELLMPGQYNVPQGPPPPYQEHAPRSMYRRIHETAQLQLVQRVTIIHNLPFGKYAAGEEKEKHDKMRECAICMMDFVTGDTIRFLPCMHYYHIRCVDDWLMRSLTCPTCMQRVDLTLTANQNLWSQSSAHQRQSSTSSMSSESSQSSSGSAVRLRSARSVVPPPPPLQRLRRVSSS